MHSTYYILWYTQTLYMDGCGKHVRDRCIHICLACGGAQQVQLELFTLHARAHISVYIERKKQCSLLVDHEFYNNFFIIKYV